MKFNLNTLLTLFLTSSFSMPMLANAESSEQIENADAYYAHRFLKLDQNDNDYLAWSEVENKDSIDYSEFMKADINDDVKLNANEYANAKANELTDALD